MLTRQAIKNKILKDRAQVSRAHIFQISKCLEAESKERNA